MVKIKMNGKFTVFLIAKKRSEKRNIFYIVQATPYFLITFVTMYHQLCTITKVLSLYTGCEEVIFTIIHDL